MHKGRHLRAGRPTTHAAAAKEAMAAVVGFIVTRFPRKKTLIARWTGGVDGES